MFLPNKSQPHVIKGTTTLTSSYVAGTVVSVDEANFIGIMIVYTKGDETSVQIKVESSNDAGATFNQQVTQSTSGGTVTIVPAVYQITAASYPSGASDITYIINPIKADQIKISVKATGGTPTGTYKVDAITGWV